MNDELVAEAEEEIAAEIAQTEKLGLGDLVIAAVLAAVTWLAQAFLAIPGLHPNVWGEAVVAAGIRPALHVMPGYFTAFAGWVFDACGVGYGEAVLRTAGHVALALIAVLVYATMREMLAFIMRARPQRSKRRSLVMQIASLVGTVAFIVTDPVWNAGQCFSETTILIGLTLGALEFYFLFLRKGAIKWAYFCAMALGFLCAESPLGFLFLIAFVALNFVVLKVLPVLESPFFRPEVIAVGKWYMTFLFFAALVLGIGLNCWTFAAHDGLAAVGKSAGDVPLDYLIAYWGRIAGAADLTGWMLLVGACITPFVVTIVRFPSAADEEVFLPYSTGIVFFFCGLIALAQSGPIPELWFWTYSRGASPYLLSFGTLLAAITVAGAVTILGVDSLCRNHQRLAMQQFGTEDEDGAAIEPVHSRSSTLVRRVGMVVIPLALLATMLPGRLNPAARSMFGIIADVISEIVDEAGDAEYIFTDGNLDPAIELESVRRGGCLKCLSLLGGKSPYDVYLRTRGMKDDEEDMFSFGFDSAMGLRSWIRDKPGRLKKCAAQMGFDLWKRDGKQIPPIGGILSRPAGWPDEAERLAGVQRAYALIDRILALASAGHATCPDADVRRVFSSVMWRLSRACVYRGERADLAGDAKTAIAEAERGQRLNDRNETYKELEAAIMRQRERMTQQLTTREGLQLALVRADFRMGKLYAEKILAADPENSDANFAMGMYFLGERQLSRAEEYLMRCLIHKPNEPAVYNNIAMIQLELGRLDAAEANARKALAIIPESAAVLDTLHSIEKARAESAKAAK